MLSRTLLRMQIDDLLAGREITVIGTDDAMALQAHMFAVHNIVCPVWCERIPTGIVYIVMRSEAGIRKASPRVRKQYGLLNIGR